MTAHICRAWRGAYDRDSRESPPYPRLSGQGPAGWKVVAPRWRGRHLRDDSATAALVQSGDSDQPKVGIYAWALVALLCAAAMIAAIDRGIINLLVEPLKADLALTDTEISLLQGFAFAAFHTLAALPLGRMADSGSRKVLVAAGLLVWSLATAACGLARNFATLFSARVAVGAGEAALTPAAYSLLGDTFPRERLGRAISVFLAAEFIGSGLALSVGGFVLAAAEGLGTVDAPIVGRLAPWQMTLLIVSVPGIICAAVALAMREPARVRKAHESADVPRLGEFLQYLSRNRRSLAGLLLGFSLLASGQFALGAWVPAFFVRTYGWSASEIGKVYGLYFMVFGTLGVLAGGWTCDALWRRGWRDANMRTALLAAAPLIPLVIAFPLTGSATASLVLLAPISFLGSFPFSAGTAAIPMFVPNRFRGQVVALYLLTANLVGPGLGPWLVATGTDRIFHDPSLLRFSLAGAAALLITAALAVIAAGLPSFRRQVEDAMAHR
jgi:MFS family permease